MPIQRTTFSIYLQRGGDIRRKLKLETMEDDLNKIIINGMDVTSS